MFSYSKFERPQKKKKDDTIKHQIDSIQSIVIKMINKINTI